MGELERLNEVLRFVFLKIGIYKKADMAEYLGYKSPYFSGIINGKEKLSEAFLRNISDKLNVNTDYILEGKGDMIKSVEQSISNVSESSVIGSNVNGNGNHITNNEVTVITKLVDSYQEIIREKDNQINRLISVIEKQENKYEL